LVPPASQITLLSASPATPAIATVITEESTVWSALKLKSKFVENAPADACTSVKKALLGVNTKQIAPASGAQAVIAASADEAAAKADRVATAASAYFFIVRSPTGKFRLDAVPSQHLSAHEEAVQEVMIDAPALDSFESV
jgi:hypothetical protein